MLDPFLPLTDPMERAPPARLREHMDRADCDPERLRDALETLSRANGRFRARTLTVAAAADLLDGGPRGPVRILDVGTGGGDMAVSLARRLRSGGWRPYPVLADLHPETLRIARERVRPPEPGTETADSAEPGSAGRAALPANRRSPGFVRLTAAKLPFRTGSVDVAVSATMLHHLGRDEAAEFLRELDRVTTRGWVVTDLRRSRTAYAAVRLLAATLWRSHPLPRHDGPVSVRRAFTPAEVRGLAEEAGVGDASVESVWPFRLRIVRRAA